MRIPDDASKSHRRYGVTGHHADQDSFACVSSFSSDSPSDSAWESSLDSSAFSDWLSSEAESSLDSVDSAELSSSESSKVASLMPTSSSFCTSNKDSPSSL